MDSVSKITYNLYRYQDHRAKEVAEAEVEALAKKNLPKKQVQLPRKVESTSTKEK